MIYPYFNTHMWAGFATKEAKENENSRTMHDMTCMDSARIYAICVFIYSYTKIKYAFIHIFIYIYMIYMIYVLVIYIYRYVSCSLN